MNQRIGATPANQRCPECYKPAFDAGAYRQCLSCGHQFDSQSAELRDPELDPVEDQSHDLERANTARRDLGNTKLIPQAELDARMAAIMRRAGRVLVNGKWVKS